MPAHSFCSAYLDPSWGCAFAWATYAIVAGGLGSYVKAPPDETTRTLFYAALAFVSGFSEHLAQDAIVKSSGVIVNTSDAETSAG